MSEKNKRKSSRTQGQRQPRCEEFSTSKDLKISDWKRFLSIFQPLCIKSRENPCAATTIRKRKWENVTECWDWRMSAWLTNRQFVCHALHPVWLSNLASSFLSLKFLYRWRNKNEKKLNEFLPHFYSSSYDKSSSSRSRKTATKKVLNYLMKATRKCFNLTICHFWWIANVYTQSEDVRGSLQSTIYLFVEERCTKEWTKKINFEAK